MVASRWPAIASATPALAIAREVASRLQDQARLTKAMTIAPELSSYSFTAHWQATSLPCGNAGLAVLLATLDTCFPDERWDYAGHAHLSLAVQALSERPLESLGLGLFGGVCGVAFAAWLLSHQETRYQHLLESLDQEITGRINARAAQILTQRHGFASVQYDVISGLAVGSTSSVVARTLTPPKRSAPSCAP